MKPARVRNEWVTVYVKTGVIPEEVPAHLVDAVIELAEKRKPKVEVAKEKRDASVW